MVRETRYLIVRNLPENCTEETVIDHFQRYGKIQSVKLQAAKDNDSGSTATVAFNDIKSAAKAHHAKNSLGEVTLRTDYWEGSTGTPVLANATVAGSNAPRSVTYTSTTSASSRPVSTFSNWTKGPEEDGSSIQDKGESLSAPPLGINPLATASSALDKLTSTSFDLQRGRARERFNKKKFGQKAEKTGSFGRHGATTSSRSLEAARSQSEAAAAAAAAASSGPSTTTSAPSQSGPNSNSGSTAGLNPIIVSDIKDTTNSKDLKENRESSSRSRPHSVASPSSRHSGVKKSYSQSRSVSRSRSRSRGSRSSSSRSCSSGTSRSTSPHRSYSSSITRPQSMVGASRLVSSEIKEAKRDENDGDRRPLGICVTGLPIRSTDSSLRDGLYHEYKKHGKVTTVQICGDGENRCAVVSFRKPEDASKALEASQGKTFFGAKIKVTSHEGVEVDDTDRGNDNDSMDEYHLKATRTLFVGNLEKETTPQDLHDKFKKFGEIVDVDIKRQGAATAFAFVQYVDIASVVHALREMEGEHIGTNKIKLGFGKSMPTCCVWMDNLPSDASGRILRSSMTRYGEISYCYVDRTRNKGLVYFTSYEDAQRCVSDIKMRPHFMKKKLQIDFASRECQTDFLDRMENSNQLRGSDRPEENRVHKFRQQRSFEFQEDGSPSSYSFTRTTPASFSSRNGRSNSSSFRRSRQYGDSSFPEENHSSSRRSSRRPEEFSSSSYYSGKGSGDDYDAVLREYGHSQRERRERDLSPRRTDDRRVDSQSRRGSRDHSLDRYDERSKDRTVEIYNSRDASPSSEHNSYRSGDRYRSSRDDKYSSRDRYDDSKQDDIDHRGRLSRTGSPFLQNHSSMHSHDSDFGRHNGSRSQSPPTPIQEDSSMYRMFYPDDYKRSVVTDDDYDSYLSLQKRRDADDIIKPKTWALSNKLGAEVAKTAEKSRKRSHEESGLSDSCKLDNKVLRKHERTLEKDRTKQVYKQQIAMKSRVLKVPDRPGSPGSPGSHGDSENGSASEGDLQHLHQEKQQLLLKLQELGEEGTGISEPDSPRSAAKVKSVAVKDVLRFSMRNHEDRKREEPSLKSEMYRRQSEKLRLAESKRDSRNHLSDEMSATREDKSLLDEKDEIYGGNSDSDYDLDIRGIKKRRIDNSRDSESIKTKGYQRQGSVDVSDDEDLDRKSEQNSRIHSSSLDRRATCDTRTNSVSSKFYDDTNKSVDLSCDNGDHFKGGLSDRDISVIKQHRTSSKTNPYFSNVDYSRGSPVGYFSPTLSEEQTQDSVTSGSFTEKSSKHSWQHSPPPSPPRKDSSDGELDYLKDYSAPNSPEVPDDCLSDDSLVEAPQAPGERTWEERIRAIDEILNMTASTKSADQSLLDPSLSNKDITNNNDNTTLYSKYRIRKRDGGLEGGNGSLLIDKKPEPSVFMQQLLMKNSILDQDCKRLEQMNEKYDPGSVKELSVPPFPSVKSEVASPQLPDIKEDTGGKSVLPWSSSSSLLSTTSSHPVTTSSSMLQPTVTTSLAGSASVTAPVSTSVLTTSIVSTHVTTSSISVSSKTAAVDNSKTSTSNSSTSVEDVSYKPSVCTNSLTLKQDVPLSLSSSPSLSSSVSVLTSCHNSLSTSSLNTSHIVSVTCSSAIPISDSHSQSKPLISSLPLPPSLVSQQSVSSSSSSSTFSSCASSTLLSNTTLQQSVLSSSLTTSSSVTQSLSRTPVAAPFTQGPLKSQLMPTVGQEAPRLCSPSFTPENSRTSVNSHLPGSRSPRVSSSHNKDQDDQQTTNNKPDLSIVVSHKTISGHSEEESKVKSVGSKQEVVTPDIESPVSVKSEASSNASVPLSSLDNKNSSTFEDKSLLAPLTISTQASSPRHSNSSSSQRGQGSTKVETISPGTESRKTVVEISCEKEQSSLDQSLDKTTVSKNISKCDTSDILSGKKSELSPPVTTVLSVISKDNSDKELPSPSDITSSSKGKTASTVSLNNDIDSASASSGVKSSVSSSTPSTSSRSAPERPEKKLAKSNSHSKAVSSPAKSEALFAPDLKLEQPQKSNDSKTDSKHQAKDKGSSSSANKSSASSNDKKNSKTSSKDSHEKKDAGANKDGDKVEKKSEGHKSSAQEMSSKPDKKADKKAHSKEGDKNKQREKEETKKKEEKKVVEKKEEKKAVAAKEDKKTEKEKKEKPSEKEASKETGKQSQMKHGKSDNDLSKKDKKLKEKTKETSAKNKEKTGEKKLLSGLSCVAKHSTPEAKPDLKSGKTGAKESKSKEDSAKDTSSKPEKDTASKSETPVKSDPKAAMKSDSKHKGDSKTVPKNDTKDGKSENSAAAVSSKKSASETSKSKKETEKDSVKQGTSKHLDKLQKQKQKEEEKQKEKQRLKEEKEKQKEKEEKERKEREEMLKQKEKEREEKERKEQEEKERKEKERKEREEKERKEKEEKERARKEKEEREKQREKEEKERKEKEEKERLKKEKEEKERKEKEEKEKLKKEKEEREKQKQKEREEREAQKEKEKAEKEKKEREEKEKQKEKERKEKERKEKEKKEKERKEKEKKAKEERLKKEKEERIKKEKEEKAKREEKEKLKKEKEEEKEKSKKEKEEEKEKSKKDKEEEREKPKKDKEEDKERSKKDKEKRDKKEKDKDREQKERNREEKEDKNKKPPPKKQKRNELAALLDSNDMFQMTFTSMYDRVKTQRNREPDTPQKNEPAPRSSFDKFKQNRKKKGSKAKSSLYSFDSTSDLSDDNDNLSPLSEESESSQKAEPVKESKPKKSKQTKKRPHLSSTSSSSCEEDDDALLRATKPKGKKKDTFNNIFSSDSEEDNFQPPSNKSKSSSKSKAKPVAKRRKTREDSTDSMASREEFVKPQAMSSVTEPDSLDDMDLSDEEPPKTPTPKKKKKPAASKSSDHEHRDSSVESVTKKSAKMERDSSVESTSKKSTKVEKEETPTKKGKAENKKGKHETESKSSVKEEVKTITEEKKKGKKDQDTPKEKAESKKETEAKKEGGEMKKEAESKKDVESKSESKDNEKVRPKDKAEDSSKAAEEKKKKKEKEEGLAKQKKKKKKLDPKEEEELVNSLITKVYDKKSDKEKKMKRRSKANVFDSESEDLSVSEASFDVSASEEKTKEETVTVKHKEKKSDNYKEKPESAKEKEVSSKEKEVSSKEKEVPTKEKEVSSKEKEVSSKEKDTPKVEKHVEAKPAVEAAKKEHKKKEEKKDHSEKKEMPEKKQELHKKEQAEKKDKAEKEIKAEKEAKPEPPPDDGSGKPPKKKKKKKDHEKEKEKEKEPEKDKEKEKTARTKSKTPEKKLEKEKAQTGEEKKAPEETKSSSQIVDEFTSFWGHPKPILIPKRLKDSKKSDDDKSKGGKDSKDDSKSDGGSEKSSEALAEVKEEVTEIKEEKKSPDDEEKSMEDSPAAEKPLSSEATPKVESEPTEEFVVPISEAETTVVTEIVQPASSGSISSNADSLIIQEEPASVTVEEITGLPDETTIGSSVEINDDDDYPSLVIDEISDTVTEKKKMTKKEKKLLKQQQEKERDDRINDTIASVAMAGSSDDEDLIKRSPVNLLIDSASNDQELLLSDVINQQLPYDNKSSNEPERKSSVVSDILFPEKDDKKKQAESGSAFGSIHKDKKDTKPVFGPATKKDSGKKNDFHFGVIDEEVKKRDEELLKNLNLLCDPNSKDKPVVIEDALTKLNEEERKKKEEEEKKKAEEERKKKAEEDEKARREKEEQAVREASDEAARAVESLLEFQSGFEQDPRDMDDDLPPLFIEAAEKEPPVESVSISPTARDKGDTVSIFAGSTPVPEKVTANLDDKLLEKRPDDKGASEQGDGKLDPFNLFATPNQTIPPASVFTSPRRNSAGTTKDKTPEPVVLQPTPRQMQSPQRQMQSPQRQMQSPQKQMPSPQRQMPSPQRMQSPQRTLQSPQHQMQSPQRPMHSPQVTMASPQPPLQSPQRSPFFNKDPKVDRSFMSPNRELPYSQSEIDMPPVQQPQRRTSSGLPVQPVPEQALDPVLLSARRKSQEFPTEQAFHSPRRNTIAAPEEASSIAHLDRQIPHYQVPGVVFPKERTHDHSTLPPPVSISLDHAPHDKNFQSPMRNVNMSPHQENVLLSPKKTSPGAHFKEHASEPPVFQSPPKNQLQDQFLKDHMFPHHPKGLGQETMFNASKRPVHFKPKGLPEQPVFTAAKGPVPEKPVGLMSKGLDPVFPHQKGLQQDTGFLQSKGPQQHAPEQFTAHGKGSSVSSQEPMFSPKGHDSSFNYTDQPIDFLLNSPRSSSGMFNYPPTPEGHKPAAAKPGDSHDAFSHDPLFIAVSEVRNAEREVPKPRRLEGFPASFYQEPVPASKPYQETSSANQQVLDDDKKGTKKRKRNNKKTTKEDRAAALAELAAIEESVQANVESIHKALNANQAKVAAEKAGGPGTEKKKTFDMYDFDAQTGQDVGIVPGTPISETHHTAQGDSDPKQLRSRSERGRGVGARRGRGRRGRGGMSVGHDMQDSFHQQQQSHFPGQESLPPHSQYNHQQFPPQQQHPSSLQRPGTQPNQTNHQAAPFYQQSQPSPMSSENSSSMSEWQLKQAQHPQPPPSLQQHQQQQVKPPSGKSDVLSPDSNKHDLDSSYGESELVINLDDQPPSIEGKENQYNLSSDGEDRGGLAPSPATPKSQRSTRARKPTDYKAIASGNVQAPVQPRTSRSGGSPRGRGTGAQSPKNNMSPRTRSTENVPSSSPVVKLEKLDVPRGSRRTREAVSGKGVGKEESSEEVTPTTSFEDWKAKIGTDENKSVSKENIYEFDDNEQDQRVEPTSLRSTRGRKKREELQQQQPPPMVDFMPGSPASSSNSSSLFQEPKSVFETPTEAKVPEESSKTTPPLSNVDAVIEAVSKGLFGDAEEDSSVDITPPPPPPPPPATSVPSEPVQSPASAPGPPSTRSTRRSTEAKKEADAKAEKTIFSIAEPPRFDGRETGRKGPTVPPLRIKVAHGTPKVEKNEEKHYVISEHHEKPLAFTVKLSDGGTTTKKPAGAATTTTAGSQLVSPGGKNQTGEAFKNSDGTQKKDSHLGLFSGSELLPGHDSEMGVSSGASSQFSQWKPLDTVVDDTVVTKTTGALHPKVAAKVQASQEAQNSVSQGLPMSQQSTPPSSVPSSMPSHSKSSPVTGTAHGMKHVWAGGHPSDTPHQPLTPGQPSPNSHLPAHLQNQSQLSSPLSRDGGGVMHQQRPPSGHQEPKRPPSAHNQPVLRSGKGGNKHGGMEMNSEMTAKLATESQKHSQGPFGFPPHVPPAHSGQRPFLVPPEQQGLPPGHMPMHYPNSAGFKPSVEGHSSKSPSIQQAQANLKMGTEVRTRTPPVTSGAMLYSGVVSRQPQNLSPTSASPEGQVIERLPNPLTRGEPGQTPSPLGMRMSGSHHQDPSTRFLKDEGHEGQGPPAAHAERPPVREISVYQQIVEQQRLQQHLYLAQKAAHCVGMAQEAARNSGQDSGRNVEVNRTMAAAMRNVHDQSRSTPSSHESGRKGSVTTPQTVGLSHPLNLSESDSRSGHSDPSRGTPKSTPPAPQSPFQMSFLDRKGDSSRLPASVASAFLPPGPGGHREGIPPHLYPELSLPGLGAHPPFGVVGRLPIDPRIYGPGQQPPPPHLLRDGVLAGHFPQGFPPGAHFPSLEQHSEKKGETGHPDQATARSIMRSPSPSSMTRQLQENLMRQQLTRMPHDLPTRDSPVGILQRYPVMWQGALALKNENSYVQMHFIAGNRRLPNQALPQPMQNGALPPLRISQRMRLEQQQLEGVAKRMQCEDDYCILIAVACGRDQMDINHQTRSLNEGFITYLHLKQAAGIVNVPLPGSEQAGFVVHIFPPCEFVDNSVAQQGSPALMEQLREVPHAVIIIATT